MRFILFALLCCLGVQPVFAQYRCTEAGKTVYQERPCAATEASPRGAGDKVVGDTANSAYATTSGAWRGQVQFMAKAGNAVIAEAHVVSPFVIEIDPRGKVTGSGSEAGCVIKGIAKPGMSRNITELDVTLSKCNYSPFNRQMSGWVALYSERRYVELSLNAYDVNRRPGGYFEVKGTLRR